MMMNKIKDLEWDLLEKIESEIPRGGKSSSVEEAMKRALGLVEDKYDEPISEDEWR